MTPVQKYLEQTGLSRHDLATLMAQKGWRPSESTLSRWISGERKPTSAGAAMLFAVSCGKIIYK